MLNKKIVFLIANVIIFVFAFIISTQSLMAQPFQNGDLIRNVEDKKVYLIDDGKLRHVPNWATLEAREENPQKIEGKIRNIPKEQWSSFSVKYPEVAPLVSITKSKEAELGLKLLDNKYSGISQDYTNSFSGMGGKRHPGIDFYAVTDTDVRSPINGTVTRVGEKNRKGEELGTLAIKVDGTNPPVYFLFLHLSEFGKNVGEEVKIGEVIGKTGDTGTKYKDPDGIVRTHPHLHVEVSKDNHSQPYYPKDQGEPPRNLYPADIFEGTLIREKDTSKVYKIENGQKRWIDVTSEQFSSMGYKWENVIEVDTTKIAEVKIMAEGSPIRPAVATSSPQANLNAKLNPKGFLAKLKDLSSDVWNATVGIRTAQAPTTSRGVSGSWENASTIAQTQNLIKVDNNPPFTSQGNYWGYIGGMLTKNGTFEATYATLEPTYLATSNIRVPSYNSNRGMTMNGISSPPQITSLETSTGAVTIGIPVSIDMHELGNNSYMRWGYWLQTNVMQAGGTNYYFDNRGYYLTGDPATNAQMTNLMANNVSGTYSGTANGTYWTNTGGANMSGSFSANVSFAARSLNGISISISGSGHSASISGATATFSGSSSTFVGNSDGQWKIDGATLGSSVVKELRGAVGGPTGKAVGGGFGMGQSPATTGVVIGVFQGTR
jgi:murein DD-endopeptidase MepM/ murein hydrolase activator NlpD